MDTENVAWQRATNDQSDVLQKILHVVFYVQGAWHSPDMMGSFTFFPKYFICSAQLTLFAPQALVSFKKYMPPPLPYFKVNICPFPLPHFASIFFRLFVILSLTQLYRYTPEIFLFSTATFKYIYRAPLRRIGQEYSANVAWSTFQSLKRIQPLPVCA